MRYLPREHTEPLRMRKSLIRRGGHRHWRYHEETRYTMVAFPYGGALIGSPNEDPIWVWYIDAAVRQNLGKEVIQ